VAPVSHETFNFSATNTPAVSFSGISTTQTDYILLLAIYNEHAGSAAATVTSVVGTGAGSGLTWALRKRSNSSVTGGLELWWAHATLASTTYGVTVNFSGAYDDCACCIAVISGCGSAIAPFDTNAGLPAAQSAPTPTWTPSFTGVNTSTGNDLLLFLTGTVSGGGTPAVGFTNIATGSTGGGSWAAACRMDAQAVVPIQSGATFTYGAALTNTFGAAAGEAIFDALASTVIASGMNWDPVTVAAVNLSNGNLTATNTGTTSTNQGAHVAFANAISAGKLYFEVTLNTFTGGAGVGVGIGSTAATYAGISTAATSGSMCMAVGHTGTGTIMAGPGGNTGYSIGARTSGNVIGVAVDFTDQLCWFRLCPSGLWNGTSNHNPAVPGPGGIPMTSGGNVPFVTFGNGLAGQAGVAGNVWTANFSGPFVGAIPAGFTAWGSVASSSPVTHEVYGAAGTNLASFSFTGVSTTQTDYIALIAIYNENAGSSAATVSSITSAGMTWRLRKRSKGTATGDLELWWAHGTGALSGYSITVNMAGTYDDVAACLVFVSGCGSPTAPFDANASLPAAQSAPTPTWTPSFTGISTSSPNDLLLFLVGTVAGGGTPPTGFSFITNFGTSGGAWAANTWVAGMSVSVLQNNATFINGNATSTIGGGTSNEAIFDALTNNVPTVPSAKASVMVFA
jgi:hypothetical protein